MFQNFLGRQVDITNCAKSYWFLEIFRQICEVVIENLPEKSEKLVKFEKKLQAEMYSCKTPRSENRVLVKNICKKILEKKVFIK